MNNYRSNLLPLIDGWKRSKARVALFGTGPHTDFLFDIVPELGEVDVVGYLDTNPARNGTIFRTGTVHLPEWAEDNADVVLCSSQANELEQVFRLNGCKTKVVVSHFPPGVYASSPAKSIPASGIFVPMDHADVLTPPGDDTQPFIAIKEMMDAQHDQMRSCIAPLLRHYNGLSEIPHKQVDDISPFWDNGYFSGDDARIAYAMVREYNPKRIVEIGGGNSTKFFRRAINDSSAQTELISIDPEPRSTIDQLCHRRIARGLQSVPLSFFDILEAGDILFFDGSHLVFQGSDCAYFFLRLLPLVPVGVHVHIHDIMLPYAYPPHFDQRYYNEQHLLAAFLLGNDAWRVRIPVHYLAMHGDLREGGASFWIERVR